jgi:hypothetical protein
VSFKTGEGVDAVVSWLLGEIAGGRRGL